MNQQGRKLMKSARIREDFWKEKKERKENPNGASVPFVDQYSYGMEILLDSHT